MMRLFKAIFTLSLLFGAMSCSSDGVESKTTFTFVPSQPVLIATDFSYTKPPLTPEGQPETVTVTGAWFQFDFRFSNPTDKQVTITSIEVTATGRGPNGEAVEATEALTTADLPINQGSNQSAQLYLFSTPPGGISSIADIQGLPAFTLGGFPKKPEVVNTRLQLRVVLYGWVGTPTVPVASYEKTMFVTTQ